MNDAVIIRNEIPADYTAVEAMTRNAFWNLYVPGCAEHYLVHIMRNHPDFLPTLDLVMEKDGQIIGNIMYTKASLLDEAGTVRNILTFGPVCIAPEHQRKGYGKRLLAASFAQALAMGYEVVVIYGDPGNYVGSGFKSCKKYNVCLQDGRYPSAMLVKELKPGLLDGRKWVYQQSSVFEIDEQEAQRYDDTLPPMEKKTLPCQETFYIHSHSVVL